MLIIPQDKIKIKTSIRSYLEALLWAIVLALVIRSWVFQAFKIPSGSMKPTLLVGDHLLVSKSSYGIRLPFINQILIPLAQPKRGDIIIFRCPEARDKDFIKRIIGLPGDKVEIRNKIVFINDQFFDDPWGAYLDYFISSSNVYSRDNFGPIEVPLNHFFVMGDNRDQSYDSRFWFGGKGGFVNREDIIGKAIIIYWSWEEDTFGVRWSRLFRLLN